MHRMVYIINKAWLLDLDAKIGYKVHFDKCGNEDMYTKAFEYTCNDTIEFSKYINVPIKVLKEAKIQIEKYNDKK